MATGVAFGLAGCGGDEKEVLNIYTWADNFDQDLIDQFAKENNVKVNMDVYASNEEMLAKIQAGGAQYDIIQPSDYMVKTMVELDLLEEINKENVPNFKNLYDKFENPEFDPESKHAIVYTTGVTGIAYNKKYVKETPDSWADLWDPAYKGRVVLLDDSREVLGMGLIKNKFSNSTTDVKQIEKAYNDLKALLPNLLAFDTNNIKQKFIGEEAYIGTVWSGDTAFIYAENKDVDYVVPKEGATIWADTLAIPKGAKHKELAEKFINFVLDSKVAAQNYEAIGYMNPNEASVEFQSEEFKANKFLNLPEADLNRTQWLTEVGKTLKVYDEYWTKLKTGKSE
ncbi:MAG: spermidine/putrescine ABC transporter substrate-binding protein [Bacillaceae bacterium]